MPDTFYTTADLARMFSVTQGRIRALVRQRTRKLGREIGRKVGQTWIFTAEEIELLRPGPAGWPKRGKKDE